MAKVNAVSKDLGNQRLRTNACIYGAPKSGKSEAVSKLSKYFNLIWCDLENGWEILLKLPEEQQGRIELIRIPDTRGTPTGIETVMKLVRGNKLLVCEEHGKADPLGCPECRKAGKPMVEICLNETGADTIFVIDSGSALTMSAIARVCVANQKGDTEYPLQIQDWGTIAKWLDSVFSYIQAARFHSITITHEEMLQMEDKKTKLVPSIGTTNYAAKCARFFSHVVHLDVVNNTHIANSATTSSNIALVGSRTDVKLEDAKGKYQLLELFLPYLTGEKRAAAEADIAKVRSEMKK